MPPVPTSSPRVEATAGPVAWPHARSIRVAMFSPFSLSRPGGVQGQVLGLTNGLREIGVDARAYAPCDGPPPEPGVTQLGRSIPVVANGSIAPVAPDPAAQLRVLRALHAERPDVVHLHEPFAIGTNWTVVLATGFPIVATFHAAGHQLYRTFGPMCRWAARRRFRAMMAVSDAARELVETNLGGPVRVLPNGVDVGRFAKADPWPTERPAILFVGRHESRKGLRVLLDAFDGLDRDADLWVVGSGPETAELATRHRRGVHWLGQIGDGELARRMRSASLYCAPSLHSESFGVVLLEAMAAGTPIVASDIGGYRDVARHDVEALLVAPGDTNALRAAMTRVLDDRSLAERLLDGGRLRADECSMSHLAEQYAEIYENVLGRTPRSVQ
jgi:phosphatidylinositol alpha-mannosyltransferase